MEVKLLADLLWCKGRRRPPLKEKVGDKGVAGRPLLLLILDVLELASWRSDVVVRGDGDIGELGTLVKDKEDGQASPSPSIEEGGLARLATSDTDSMSDRLVLRNGPSGGVVWRDGSSCLAPLRACEALGA